MEAAHRQPLCRHELGHFGHAMIGGQHDEGILKPDRLIDESEEIGQGAVEPQHHVFVFQAGRPEKVVDRINR